MDQTISWQLLVRSFVRYEVLIKNCRCTVDILKQSQDSCFPMFPAFMWSYANWLLEMSSYEADRVALILSCQKSEWVFPKIFNYSFKESIVRGPAVITAVSLTPDTSATAPPGIDPSYSPHKQPHLYSDPGTCSPSQHVNGSLCQQDDFCSPPSLQQPRPWGWGG